MSLPLGIFSDRPLRMRIDRRSHQICQWEYIWSYFHLAEFNGTGGGDIQSPGHQTERDRFQNFIVRRFGTRDFVHCAAKWRDSDL